MGQHDIKSVKNSQQIRLFEKNLLRDIRALEAMLKNELFETGVSRIGAEQELFIVDESFRPHPHSLRILKTVDDPHFTTELGGFNLEFNLDPLPFSGNCLSVLEQDLEKYISKIRNAANKHNADVVLTGILPTLKKTDLGLENMTPKPRYYALNEAMTRMRGEHYDLFFRGMDELYVKHDSVMLESCNTSFQVHFQVSPNDFARFYNIAQAMAAPVLAAAVNSPMLFGKRLWNETRISIFQQSTDTRSVPRHMRQTRARVHFGSDWVKDSVVEIFKEEIARFRVLMALDLEEDSLECLENKRIPKLHTLQLHNGTVYPWTRPCYGVTDGKPHLRIENRILPSGPTIHDEVANAAFWFGLINGISHIYKDITRQMDFDDAKSNFYAAARRGLKAQFSWFKNQTVPAQEVILEQLLPIANDGLSEAGIDKKDIANYLGTIKRRVKKGQTGSEWMLRSFGELKKYESVDKSLFAITRAMYRNQKQGKPVHEWPMAKPSAKGNLTKHYLKVEQFMSTDLFTVNKEDSVGLVVNVMSWRRIRHIPVEDNKNRLVGLVNYRSLVTLLQKHEDDDDKPDYALIPVKAIMQKKVPYVTPDTSTLDAIAAMRKHGVSCLPVVHEEHLVGIVTEHDFMNLTAQFLEAGQEKNR